MLQGVIQARCQEHQCAEQSKDILQQTIAILFLVHDKKGADTFPADFADFLRRFTQIFQILFLKISVNLRKYRRNLRGNVSQPFLSCTEHFVAKIRRWKLPISRKYIARTVCDFDCK
jgi:hypothetical protein